MFGDIKKLLQEIKSFSSTTPEEIDQFRISLLSKKGKIAGLFAEFKNIAPEKRKEFGQKVNELKKAATEKVEALKKQINTIDSSYADFDLSCPADPVSLGTRHPLSIIRNEIIDIFKRIGFNVAEGPEIEDDWHNFSGLNFPEEHPARDMQDTFFIEKDPDILLRTHTSSAQVRVMETSSPPIRSIFPGRVFRNEAISARAHCIFHQIEGLYIDKNVSFADMKQTLYYFSRELFGKDIKLRLRPSFFPFTEPSAELDISCSICGGKGCNVCKYSGWLEILGCGMLDPNVLKSSNIDPEIYTGFAFGMGIERTAMLKYMVNDLRLYFENDIRFLEQFRSAGL
ncbi:phenylalanine--tRNA ligase subunit alpha [Bacteroidota bacterium]